MKTRNQAVRAAALAAVAVVMAVAMAAPAHAALRDYSWGSMHLGFGRAQQASAVQGGGTYAVRQARVSMALLLPLRDWDLPGVLPSPVVTIIGDF